MEYIEDIKQLDIDGLYYIKLKDIDGDNTVTELDTMKWKRVSNSAKSRLVQHYGYKYNYLTSNTSVSCDPLPEFLEIYKDILTEFCVDNNLVNVNANVSGNKDDKIDEDEKQCDYFNQCIVNNYDCGQGIGKHVDARAYGRVIGCFTIGSGASMIFRNLRDKNDKHEYYMEPNTMYIMSKDARYKWTHEMPSRKSDKVDGTKIVRDRRISITFRNVP
jgi:hypothetical protein